MALINRTTLRLPLLTTACLMSVALPSFAQDDTETAATSVDYTVSIPSINAVDSDLDDATLTDILSGNIADHAEALAQLDATSILVPEIIVTVSAVIDGEPSETTLTLSDFALEDVAEGVASTVSLGGIDLVSDEGTFSFGTMSAANFDIGGVLGFYGMVDGGGQTALTTIYTDFTAEGGTLDAEDATCTFGGMAGAEVRARPLQTSFVDLITMAEQMEASGEEVDPALLGRFVRMYADILTAFETSEFTFDGFSCEGVDDEDRPISFAIGGITMAGMTRGIYPSISMDGLSIAVEGDGSVALDSLVIKETDLKDVIKTLSGAPEEIGPTWLEENARALIPAFGGLSFAGLAIDVPNPDTPDTRIQANVGAFDLTLADYINGVPATSDVSASNIQAELPEDSGDETLDQLRALGLTSIDAGFRFAAAWNDATDTIEIEEFSVTGVDLATVTLAGTIANATSDLFAIDEDTAMAAAMGVAVRSLDLSIVDDGLSDIIIAQVAAEQGANPETLRPVFAGLAQGTVISVMAGAADAVDLGQTINAFVSGAARTLEIGIEAREEPGIGLADFMAAEEDPASLIGRVNITAEAR